MTEKTGKIFQAMQNVNDDLRVIEKNQPGFQYMFRGIDSVLNTLGPLFKKHKILTKRSHMEVLKYENAVNKKGDPVNHIQIKVAYTFFSTEDGSELFSFGAGEGVDFGDKALACAISNSYKYVIFEMFNIPTAEQIDSDMKTAKENKVEAPKKKKEEPKDEQASKKASFRNKKAKKPGEL